MELFRQRRVDLGEVLICMWSFLDICKTRVF
ncbi:unnamed protein product [Linum tenue]|uniref:Uncharacterized protein n=1 Tax=Linum tenue TaxID=586396 RepID=A0AAV0S009_9ROSI|nr:unnamed protein product [Linum tenue]